MAIHAGNSEGFSMIEMMIALLITAISLLALSAAMVSSVAENLKNELRNAAVRLTNQTAEVLLAAPNDSIDTCGITPDPGAPNYQASYTYDDANSCLGILPGDYKKYPNPVQSVKGFHQHFNIVWTVLCLNSNLKQVAIAVAYKHGNENHVNISVVYKHRSL